MRSPIEGPGRSKEYPPSPKVGTWWEYEQGDTEQHVIIGIKTHQGEKLVKLASRQVMRESAGLPETAIARSVSVPLKEFESRLKLLKKAPRGVAPEFVSEVIALFDAQQGAERVLEPAERSETKPSAPESVTPHTFLRESVRPPKNEHEKQLFEQNKDLFQINGDDIRIPYFLFEYLSAREAGADIGSPKAVAQLANNMKRGGMSIGQVLGKDPLIGISTDDVRELYRREGLLERKPAPPSDDVPPKKFELTNENPTVTVSPGAEPKPYDFDKPIPQAPAAPEGVPDTVRVRTPRGDVSRPITSAEAELPKPPEPETGSWGPARENGNQVGEARGDAERGWEAMKNTEDAYLSAYKEFLTTRKSRTEPEPEELQRLREAYSAAKLDYRSELNEYASARLKQRESRVVRTDKVLERYDRLVAYRETIKKPAERKLQVRYEVLDARKRNLFHKALGKAVEANAVLENKLGKNGARAVRALAAATLAGGAAFFGSGAAAIAAVGWGAVQGSRVFLGTLAGAALGENLSRTADERTQKKQTQSENELRSSVRDGDLTLERLAELEEAQERITGKTDERARLRHRTIVRSLTSIGIGAGTSALLATLPSFEAAADAGRNVAEGLPDATPLEQKGFLGDTIRQVQELNEQTASNAQAATMEAVPTPTAPEGLVAGATIDTPGEGTNQLFLDLKQSIRGNGLLSQNPSPALQHILDSNVNQLSHDLGTEAWNSSIGDNGLLTRMGDQIIIDENQNVWVQQGDNPPQLYLENTSAEPGGFRIHQIEPATSVDALATTPIAEAAPSPGAAPEIATPSTPGIPQTETEAADVQTPIPEVVAPTSTEIPTPDPSSVPVEAVTSTTGESAVIGTPLEARLNDEVIGGVAAPAPMPEGAVPESSGTPLDREAPIGTPLEDRLSDPSLGAGAAPAESWTPGTPPAEPAAFRMQGTNEVFVHGAGTPEQNLQMAQDYARTHPGVRVYFDNPKERWAGFLSPEPRVGSIEFDQNGNPAHYEPQEVDNQGRALASVEDRLEQRLA